MDYMNFPFLCHALRQIPQISVRIPLFAFLPAHTFHSGSLHRLKDFPQLSRFARYTFIAFSLHIPLEKSFSTAIHRELSRPTWYTSFSVGSRKFVHWPACARARFNRIHGYSLSLSPSLSRFYESTLNTGFPFLGIRLKANLYAKLPPRASLQHMFKWHRMTDGKKDYIITSFTWKFVCRNALMP